MKKLVICAFALCAGSNFVSCTSGGGDDLGKNKPRVGEVIRISRLPGTDSFDVSYKVPDDEEIHSKRVCRATADSIRSGGIKVDTGKKGNIVPLNTLIAVH